MRLVALILATSASAWAASDGAWTMTFRYPPQPVMLPSRCSTTCLRSQTKPWVDPWAKPKPKDDPAPKQPPNPIRGTCGFVSGTPEKPPVDDFQEWLKSDPGVLRRRAREQDEQAKQVLDDALDGRTKPKPQATPREEEAE